MIKIVSTRVMILSHIAQSNRSLFGCPGPQERSLRPLAVAESPVVEPNQESGTRANRKLLAVWIQTVGVGYTVGCVSPARSSVVVSGAASRFLVVSSVTLGIISGKDFTAPATSSSDCGRPFS
jgi:hypothetical protein